MKIALLILCMLLLTGCTEKDVDVTTPDPAVSGSETVNESEPASQEKPDGTKEPDKQSSQKPEKEQAGQAAPKDPREPAAQDKEKEPEDQASQKQEKEQGESADPLIEMDNPDKPFSPSGLPEVAPGEELLALADTEEEARKIASLYGIELVRFSYGVATYHTDRDLKEVISQGEKNGWPVVSINYIQTID
ncbi:MAG: hypothetical protein K6G83_13580 [Lachnospiraceae bacterium]|nr:hypothetical protein [Lachnospiraceae bacterium]